ncbi:MAG: hydroxymyristoyl-ACP dehydratase [Bacteroidetes bacterium]|nr:hydroxymyristoyl-ACP dehydratase [Bacteroidota bacterium]MCC6837572.1 hydroxymyristoyl-ACP dehydratase [Bacteroidia bacterium]
MEKPIIEGAAVSALIPQKPPIEMVDKLWFNDETTTISGFTIKADNIFCENGEFTEPGIVENIAQTAALRVGYMVSLLEKNGEKVNPPVGYIGAIKRLNIHQLPKVGAELKTEVIIQQIIFDVTLITGRSTVNGEPVADCEMKIFLKKD